MDRHIEALVRRLRREPSAEAIWLFGSRASGDARPDSDIDVAVLGLAAPTLAAEIRLLGELSSAAGGLDVDLVRLEDASPLLRLEAVVRGRRLWARDSEQADEYEHRCLMEYLDTEYMRSTQQALHREALS